MHANSVMWKKLSGYALTRLSNVLFGAGLVGIQHAARVDGGRIELHSGARGG